MPLVAFLRSRQQEDICHPEFSTISIIQMLPSGWITRWSNTCVRRVKPIPCNLGQDFCRAGKIDRSLILIKRDAKTIGRKGTDGASEMVIAVRPYGVLKIIRVMPVLYVTGPLQ